MKHLDALFDELQEPIAQLMDWCKEDQDRAISACLKDLALVKNDNVLFDAISEAFPLLTAYGVAEIVVSISEDYVGLDLDKLYLPLEHIINDRIEVYNKS